MHTKQWKFSGHDRARLESLMDRCQVSPIVAQLLLNRNISEEEDVRRFLEAKLTDLRPPHELPGVTPAAERILAAIKAEVEIVVYGDYDADGMTATAILYRCLKLLGARVVYDLPNRLEEGYGLHIQSLEKLSARGKKMIITVDCGIASIEAASRAKELGLTLIITDHHRYGDRLPDAEVLVHPGLPGTDYPFVGLCGAGVAFKLAWALCQQHCGSTRVTEHLRDFLLQAIGLAAIGTVADVVPLLDENRVIVRNGLRSLKENAPPGLSRLMAVANLLDKQKLNSDDIGFALAPRLNAAGRLGQAQLGVELLTTEDTNRADALATYIDELNGNRTTLERSIHLAASKQIREIHRIEEDPAFVVASPNWHPGVIGIVAGKLAEKYHKPVVLIALDKLGVKPGTGSARSPNGVNLHLALQQCRDWLVTGGGHAAAAGMTVDDTRLDGFRSAFLEAVAEQSSEADSQSSISIDAEATLDQLDLPMVTQIEQLEPFGMDNARPVFCALDVHIAEEPKIIGPSGKTISMQLSQYGKRMRAVAFRQADEWMPGLQKVDSTIDVAFRPVINEFRGFRKVEIQLMDWRVHSSGESQTQLPPQPHMFARDATTNRQT